MFRQTDYRHCVCAVQWGSVAEWVSGIGASLAAVAAAAAAIVALKVSNRAQSDAREARRAVSRDRTVDLFVQLVRAVEHDIAAAEQSDYIDIIIRSPEGSALCRALWGHRNLFGTTWAVYCEDDQAWINQLRESGALFPRMRDELQRALDALDHEDRAA